MFRFQKLTITYVLEYSKAIVEFTLMSVSRLLSRHRTNPLERDRGRVPDSDRSRKQHDRYKLERCID